MPLPLIAIGIGVAAASGTVTISQTMRVKKHKKIYQEAYTHAEAIQDRLECHAAEFNRQAEDYGRAKAQETVYLQKAVDFLEKAKLKHREFQVGTAPETFQADMERIELQTEMFKAVMRAASGPAASAAALSAPAGLYAAVGLFGTASTGTAISSLSGAAAHSATLAAIGRMIGIGGAGMAAGSATLTAVSVGLNIVTLPISLGAAAWSVKKGNDVRAQVETELRKLAEAEAEMETKMSIISAISRNMSLNQRAMAAARNSLTMELAQANPRSMEDAHAVYELANLLSHAIDVTVITPQQARQLGIEVKQNGNLPARQGGH